MNDEPEQPAENTAKESLDGIVQATQEHANGVIGQLNDIPPTTQGHADGVILTLNGIAPATQTHADGVIGTLNNIAPATQTHADGVIGTLDNISPNTQAHADGVIGTLNNIAPNTQAHADGVIGTLDKIPPATQAHANGVMGTLDGIIPDTQAHADGVIGTLNGIAPATQGHADGVIGTLNGIAPDTQEHANGVIEALDEIIPVTQAHADNLTKEIESYYNELLIGGKDEEGNPISSIKTKNHEYIKDQEEKFEKLHKDLEKKILDLLPGATVARLSNAYREAKERYGSVPDKKNQGDGWFYALFIAPLAVIICLMVFGNILGLGRFIIEGDFNYSALWNRFFISSPFATLSWFGWSSIRLNRRLYEEYNHKQRVMQLYHGFNGEIEEYGREDQKQKLLDIMLQNVADKPSLAVHSGKKKINQISFFWGFFVLTRGSEKLLEPTPDTPETVPDKTETVPDKTETTPDTNGKN